MAVYTYNIGRKYNHIKNLQPYSTTIELKEVGALLTTVNGVNCKDDGDLGRVHLSSELILFEIIRLETDFIKFELKLNHFCQNWIQIRTKFHLLDC